MMFNHFHTAVFLFFISLHSLACSNPQQQQANTDLQQQNESNQEVVVGAERFGEYMPTIVGQSIGLVVNQTSVIGNTHLVDTLLQKGLSIEKVFAPEHGFRGTADAGEKVKDGIDTATGLPIISLYGNNRKPSPEQLEGISVLIFDIQDVGARFYTYISTLEYVMEACAEQNIPVIVLDRPNPNGHYVDGPVLEPEYQSFVGRQQIPVVHGMTVGEYARFLNGEKLLTDGIQTDLTVISCLNYDHKTHYELPVPPSPNLPNRQSVLLYPSLCFFEGTNLSIGRGTNKQFQIIGAPNYTGELEFTPESMPGAKYPKFENERCKGIDLTDLPAEQLIKDGQLQLQYLMNAYNYFEKNNQDFFLPNNFFDKLAGTDQLRRQLEAGYDEFKIRSNWQPGLEQFKTVRKQYLLYPDFE